MERIYFVRNELSEGSFIAIKHGETQYNRTTVYTQDHADQLNNQQGISREEAKAAMTCSILGCWAAFEALVEAEQRKQGVAA